MCSMSLGVPFFIRRKGNQQVKCIEVQLKKMEKNCHKNAIEKKYMRKMEQKENKTTTRIERREPRTQ